jgi:hypothetical protein
MHARASRAPPTNAECRLWRPESTASHVSLLRRRYQGALPGLTTFVRRTSATRDATATRGACSDAAGHVRGGELLCFGTSSISATPPGGSRNARPSAPEASHHPGQHPHCATVSGGELQGPDRARRRASGSRVALCWRNLPFGVYDGNRSKRGRSRRGRAGGPGAGAARADSDGAGLLGCAGERRWGWTPLTSSR